MSQKSERDTPPQVNSKNCITTYYNIIYGHVFRLARFKPFLVVTLTIWGLSVVLLIIFSYGNNTVGDAIKILSTLAAITLLFFFWLVPNWLKPSNAQLLTKLTEAIKRVSSQKEQVVLLRQIAETHQSAADWRGNNINFLLLGGIAALAFCLPAFWQTESAFQTWQMNKLNGWYVILFAILSASILSVSSFILRFAVDEPINRAFILACHSIEYEYERTTVAGV